LGILYQATELVKSGVIYTPFAGISRIKKLPSDGVFWLKIQGKRGKIEGAGPKPESLSAIRFGVNEKNKKWFRIKIA